MPHIMMILHFRLPYFHVQIVLYVLHSTSVLSFYMAIILIISTIFILISKSHDPICMPLNYKDRCYRTACIIAPISILWLFLCHSLRYNCKVETNHNQLGSILLTNGGRIYGMDK